MTHKYAEAASEWIVIKYGFYNMLPSIVTILPFAFQGLQTGIGSWFRANNSIDSTNGHSWCAYEYKDSTPGFAIDLLQMGNGTNPVYPAAEWYVAGKQYCGLEATVYNPNTGITLILYVTDAFDHKWVHSNGSIDIMIDSYATLVGYYPTDKNKIINDITWKFTGNRNPQYAFGGPGNKF